MNPKRWKWYTWIALVYFAINFYVNFNGAGGGNHLRVCVRRRLVLALADGEIVRAFIWRSPARCRRPSCAMTARQGFTPAKLMPSRWIVWPRSIRA